MRLENKVIVVTGASAGMGKAITIKFVKEGAKVVAVARRKDRLDELAELLKDEAGVILPYVGDLRKKEDIEGMIDLAVEQFGKLDVLVNNAGIMDDMSPVGEMTDEMLDRLWVTNAVAPIYGMRKAVNTFLSQGNGGNIINVTSVGAVHNTAGAAYCASKAAQQAVGKNVSFMYLKDGIRCNSILPGGIYTEIGKSIGIPNAKGLSREKELQTLMPGYGQPEDIAEAALFLASDESKHINGAEIVVDGGWMCL